MEFVVLFSHRLLVQREDRFLDSSGFVVVQPAFKPWFGSARTDGGGFLGVRKSFHTFSYVGILFSRYFDRAFSSITVESAAHSLRHIPFKLLQYEACFSSHSGQKSKFRQCAARGHAKILLPNNRVPIVLTKDPSSIWDSEAGTRRATSGDQNNF